SRIGHQLEDLYTRLYHFLQSRNTPELDMVEGLMKYDYLLNQKYNPRKPWWEGRLQKEDRSSIYRDILENPSQLGNEFVSLQLNEKDLYKHTLLETLAFDLQIYLQNGEIHRKNSFILTFFSPSNEGTKIFSL
ncbi:MAG TPA: DUF4080 domain-containing protein, partial [Pseudoneobacillus sp.]|nr:DUF4080 domain-containing protein [Pseudoneobacillus sp.]